MPDHRYHQYCALAQALDSTGDRWTLLIVRELVPGPRRFTDLLDGLPGVSRNLLTERLRDLERDGIVTRQALPPPAARQVYDLTDDGRDLAAAIGPLIAWGARRMRDRKPTDRFHPRWAAVAMSVLADRDAATGVRETYQFVIDRWAFYFVIHDGDVHLRDGWADDPAVTWTTDEENSVADRLRHAHGFRRCRHRRAHRTGRLQGRQPVEDDLLAPADARRGARDRRG